LNRERHWIYTPEIVIQQGNPVSDVHNTHLKADLYLYRCIHCPESGHNR